MPLLWWNHSNYPVVPIYVSHKATNSESFQDVNKVALDDFSDNMASLVQSFKYSDMNTTDKLTMVYYVINFLSEAYSLKSYTTCEG